MMMIYLKDWHFWGCGQPVAGAVNKKPFWVAKGFMGLIKIKSIKVTQEEIKGFMGLLKIKSIKVMQEEIMIIKLQYLGTDVPFIKSILSRWSAATLPCLTTVFTVFSCFSSELLTYFSTSRFGIIIHLVSSGLCSDRGTLLLGRPNGGVKPHHGASLK